MLFKAETLAGIRDGRITLAFRRWKRPTVKAGGELKTRVGVLAIDAVEVVTLKSISAEEATAAGFASLEDLLAELRGRDGKTYRVTFRLAGADPRIALRAALPTDAEIEEIRSRLARMDRNQPWTRQALRLIAEQPAVRAPDLAASIGQETQPFKQRIRRLKELGLTESLKVGYRLSPRGAAVYRALAAD